MPNIKSQAKRAMTNKKRNMAISAEKTALKNAIKNVLKAVEAKDKTAAETAYNHAASLLDKAVTSHMKHKNYVARQKSRLTTAINSL